MAVTGPVQVEQNKEFWIPALADDEEQDRMRFVCMECPLLDKCSGPGWKRAKAWSYESADQARSHVAWHLNKSSNHYLKPIDAVELALQADILEEICTFEERQQARVEAEPPVAGPSPPGGPPPPNGGGRRGPSPPGGGRRGPSPPGGGRRGPSPPMGGRRGPSPPIGGRAKAQLHHNADRRKHAGGDRHRRERSRSPRTPPPPAAALASSEIADLARSMSVMSKTMAEVLRQPASFAPAQCLPVAAGYGGSSSSTALAMPMLARREPTVEVPVAALRLLCTSLTQVREASEKLVAQLPILSASENALSQVLRN